MSASEGCGSEIDRALVTHRRPAITTGETGTRPLPRQAEVIADGERSCTAEGVRAPALDPEAMTVARGTAPVTAPGTAAVAAPNDGSCLDPHENDVAPCGKAEDESSLRFRRASVGRPLVVGLAASAAGA